MDLSDWLRPAPTELDAEIERQHRVVRELLSMVDALEAIERRHAADVEKRIERLLSHDGRPTTNGARSH
jgi:hypothetical protein